ncbi:MAG: hypothetical protein COW76_14480 [Shewanella sp. CG18_big_fil_WC_8_21_14_2_50_42_11]|nr:MAG: hypothetical protein COW76_14480 [Shewanella sp. CG18_big_fil_WC_8_21_14_2_50_42_11]PIX69420.1 MAG: hypothetical protein COZ42_19220 [Shewanella sp. CG_4_10_14_3_um_filter_42_91]PIY64430.1 MAG: hypothetical protein COY92_16355 [Shewanella sp. CG_4_10_14_0_8_um_filter_42_13]PJB93402.1 MAG: hypothetical protein CO084_01000 [Shewanella sp. CG_4_9_14_0_8_um_filter_42_14]
MDVYPLGRFKTIFQYWSLEETDCCHHYYSHCFGKNAMTCDSLGHIPNKLKNNSLNLIKKPIGLPVSAFSVQNGCLQD